MARREIDIGIVGNDGTGDSIREAFRKVNDNFKEMYAVFGQGGNIKLQDLDNVVIEGRAIFTGITTASGLMLATITPNDGSASFTRQVNATDNVTNQITCDSTINFSVNDKIVFTGSVFGNVDSGDTYYINSVIDTNNFTISLTQDGLGINRVLTSDNTGQTVRPRVMVSGPGIAIDMAEQDKITISNIGGTLSADGTPTLQVPLNAGGNIIANLGAPTQAKVDSFNSLYGNAENGGVFITLNDVAITKGYGDKNYIRKTGGGASGQIRARSEPLNKNEYTITIDEYSNTGNIVVENHGYDSGIDGAAYTYTSSTVDATGLKTLIYTTDSTFQAGKSYKILNIGTTNFTLLGAKSNSVGEVFVATTSTGAGTGQVKPVYFLRFVDEDSFSVHYTSDDANDNKNKILITAIDPDAVETLTDAYLLDYLQGNWVSTEVLPRISVVRRQGDDMTGPLTLHDHPDPFEGIGTPNGPNDLQAATKYYVDNSSFASKLNLYVTTNGSDLQSNTPPGKEGRSWAYAFASIGKACERAEYLMSIAEVETGPYRQLIAYNNGASLSVVSSYIPASPGSLATIKFTNNAGDEVDQGASNDISPGKLLVGRLSGAKGIVTQYYGDDGTGQGLDYLELKDVAGTYIPGENLEFGNRVRNLHITIHVESGVYEEDYPIKLPPNTAIVGDEFRRVLVRPRDRISQSPWVDTWFFRNTQFDGLSIVNFNNPEPKVHFVDTNLQGWFSHHYYKKPGLPLNPGPKYDNLGNYTQAANLISNKKQEIQDAVVFQINTLLGAGNALNSINEAKSKRDTGFIIDAIVSDLIEGGNEKIVNLQEVFSQVTTLSTICKQGILYIATYINTNIISTRPTAEKTLITNMINRLYFGFNSAYNTPKNNKDMDVFLCNDATIVRQITCQGHGGFMMVLDPAGQILTKSPYCQQSGSFSGSLNKHAFRGGQYIDGFCGNLKPTVVEKLSDYRLKITDIPREPEMPTSFFINGERFKVNSWLPSNTAKVNAGEIMRLNKNFVQAQTISYLNTLNVKYSLSEFTIYINRIIEALIFDTTYVGNIKTTMAARKLFKLDDLSLRIAPNQKILLLSLINYIKSSYITILANDVDATVTTNQDIFDQVIEPSLSVETNDARTIVTNLMDNLYDIVDDGIEVADDLDYPEFILQLEANSLFASINPSTITLITPGNTSMLSNDFTQVNDLGYGIVTNNKGLAECVSVFSYYTYTSMFSANGGQIRSLNSSSANGEYGLVALGSDPLEVPDTVNLADNLIQVAKVVKTGPYINSGLETTLQFYIDNFQYAPYNVSVVEIDHGGEIGAVRYEMSNVSVAETDGSGNPTILKVNLNTSGNNESSTSGLKADLTDNQNVIIRSGQNLRFLNVLETNPVRPSTALTFEGDPDLANAPVYRVIAYNTTSPIGEPLNPPAPALQDEAILTTDTTYNYIALVIDLARTGFSDLSNPGKTLGATAGDIRIAIEQIATPTTLARLNTGQMITAWDGKMHRVVSYTSAIDNIPSTPVNYGIVELAELATPININTSPVASGIQSPLTTTVTDGTVRLRCGLAAGEQANIRVRISTLRATGHDFLDIGTGGYNSSNYPTKIFGNPTPPSQAREVEERTSGRVFYVSTDQNGFFRVGRFFTVDQGTGTVKFAASIALSNLDGLGFKKGTEISEFSDDDRFTDVANDAVPTEFATDGYISYRLGLTRNNGIIPPAQRIGPGYLPLNGTIGPINDISWGGYKITSLGDPNNLSDAANKGYIDDLVSSFDSLSKKIDVITTSAEKGDVLVSFGNIIGSEIIKGFASAKVAGDLESSITSGATSTLTVAIPATGSINEITLVNASDFPVDGYVLIDEEVFYYGNKTGNDLQIVTRLSLEDNDINAKFNNGFTRPHSTGATVISLNKLELNQQIRAGSIVNADVNVNAGILQSKLSMRLAETFPESDPINGWAKTDKDQEDCGLSNFSDLNFEVDRGFVRIKSKGIAHSDIDNVAARSVLGNETSTASSPTSIPFATVFQKGVRDSLTNAGVTPAKRYVWGSLQLAAEEDSTQAAVEYTTNATGNTIVQRKNNGRTQLTGIETDGEIPVITFSGSVKTSTPVVYMGQWTAGDSASLHATSATSANNINGGVQGSLLYQSAANTTALLAPGTSGQILKTNGANSNPSWANVSDLSVGTAASLANSLTFSNNGSGASSGSSFNGSSAVTISYNSLGAASAGHTHTSLTSLTEISTGGSSIAGIITGAWTLTSGSSLQATYADLAEWYTSDGKYEPGVVLIFGGSRETTSTNIFADTRVAGIVTTDPAYTMNNKLADQPNTVCIALQGRVPCRVIGRIRKGDLLTTSATAGYAIKASSPIVGSIIGKALEDKDSLGTGVIEVAVGRM